MMVARDWSVPAWRRQAVGGYGDVDLFRIDRRIVRHVAGIAEQEPQPVVAQRQGGLCFGLSGTEVQMIEVVRDRLIERRQVRVHQKMMMPGVRLVESGWRDAHI